MKKPQYITIIIASFILILLWAFGSIVNKNANKHEGHNHEPSTNENKDGDLTSTFSIDSVLEKSAVSLIASSRDRIKELQKEAANLSNTDKKIHLFHQLSRFWKDTGKSFIPFAWYTAESARLENSEKNLTFAGQLFLDNLQQVENGEVRKWMALQAKDLLERSLKLNPDNDSARVGIGATYLFGGISNAPMQGIAKLREVINKDSTNVYAQMTLAMGSLMSGQTDLARERLETIHKLDAKNVQAILLLADIFEKQGDKTSAVTWYEKAIPLVTTHKEMQAEVTKRINDLKQSK